MRTLVVLAEGFEEIEAVTPIDLLRRAGIEVHIAGLDSINITGARSITINCDIVVDEIDSIYDAIIIPGGMPGAKNLSESKKLQDIIMEHYNRGKLIGAICAAPVVVLSPLSILDDRVFTCYPGFESRFNRGEFSESRVVVSENIVTSRGPGTAMEFSLKLIEILQSRHDSNKIKEAIIFS